MLASIPTDPQEETNTDLVGHFKNLAQRFMNTYEEQTQGPISTTQFIQSEIDRLKFEKSDVVAKKEYI